MSHTIEPVVISTISELAKYDMSLSLYCLPCDRWGEIEPSDWLSDGKPDIDYVKQKFKCGECGGKAEKQVRTTPALFISGIILSRSKYLLAWLWASIIGIAGILVF